MFSKQSKFKPGDNAVILAGKSTDLSVMGLSRAEVKFAEKEIKRNKTQVIINQYERLLIIEIIEEKKEGWLTKEAVRSAAFRACGTLNLNAVKSTLVVDMLDNRDLALAYSEALALSNYQFLKYYSDQKDRKNTLESIGIVSSAVSKQDIFELDNLVKAVYETRRLVNEPLSYLTAVQLGREISRLGKEAGFRVTVFDKKKIQELKMGGLLAVNQGSTRPPTFSIMEWKPKDAKNKKPYVLVGKGVVYDTGGVSLKPTANSMDFMKSDMGGAAAVTGAMYAISKSLLPLWVIALVPSTDNMPDANAYVPGDVVKMMSGKTVEVLNTDAEGRMILADALFYAQRYKPELVIDLATLTGAASQAVGHEAVVGMGNAPRPQMEALKQAGMEVFERIVEFPFWDDYSLRLKSDIADMKNIGGATAGAITAGKFLEKFTDYPYIHLDIAGSAFLFATDSYRGRNATGVGVRLLFEFFKSVS